MDAFFEILPQILVVWRIFHTCIENVHLRFKIFCGFRNTYSFLWEDILHEFYVLEVGMVWIHVCMKGRVGRRIFNEFGVVGDVMEFWICACGSMIFIRNCNEVSNLWTCFKYLSVYFQIICQIGSEDICWGFRQ